MVAAKTQTHRIIRSSFVISRKSYNIELREVSLQILFSVVVKE